MADMRQEAAQFLASRGVPPTNANLNLAIQHLQSGEATYLQDRQNEPVAIDAIQVTPDDDTSAPVAPPMSSMQPVADDVVAPTPTAAPAAPTGPTQAPVPPARPGVTLESDPNFPIDGPDDAPSDAPDNMPLDEPDTVEEEEGNDWLSPLLTGAAAGGAGYLAGRNRRSRELSTAREAAAAEEAARTPRPPAPDPTQPRVSGRNPNNQPGARLGLTMPEEQPPGSTTGNKGGGRVEGVYEDGGFYENGQPGERLRLDVTEGGDAPSTDADNRVPGTFGEEGFTPGTSIDETRTDGKGNAIDNLTGEKKYTGDAVPDTIPIKDGDSGGKAAGLEHLGNIQDENGNPRTAYVAPNGDVYIKDTRVNEFRKVDVNLNDVDGNAASKAIRKAVRSLL